MVSYIDIVMTSTRNRLSAIKQVSLFTKSHQKQAITLSKIRKTVRLASH